MLYKKMVNFLLFKVLIGITIGIIVGLYLPDWVNRIASTFNALFGSFLSFIIPLIIMGLIMPSIADLGKRAGKLLLLTVSIAYLFTILTGLGSYWVSSSLFPSLIKSVDLANFQEQTLELDPYFSVNIPPIVPVMSALVFSFIVGLGLAKFSSAGRPLKGVVDDFKNITIRIIEKVIIPLLPYYILGIFSSIAYKGEVTTVLYVFFKITGIIFAMHVLLLLIQFIIAGVLSYQNPFKSLLNMLPAYFTALGTQSSAATIPITLKQAKKNGVSDQIGGFVIPLCATIHLSGSTMKIVSCAIALMLMKGIPYHFEMFVGFIFMLSITMIAAPGVPGGAIMAAIGVLHTILGFNEEDQALMIALYIAMDSFGTACNVTGDGAIAMLVQRFEEKIV